MGNSVVFDRTPLELEEVLNIDHGGEVISTSSPGLTARTNVEASAISSNLLLWKFFTPEGGEAVKNAPMRFDRLTTTPSSVGKFESNQCYLILHVYKFFAKVTQRTSRNGDLPSLESVLFSVRDQLTPRGLSHTLAGTNLADTSFVPTATETFLCHDVYVWNGQRASPSVKAIAWAKGVEVDRHVKKNKNKILYHIFRREPKLPISSIFNIDMDPQEALSNAAFCDNRLCAQIFHQTLHGRTKFVTATSETDTMRTSLNKIFPNGGTSTRLSNDQLLVRRNTGSQVHVATMSAAAAAALSNGTNASATVSPSPPMPSPLRNSVTADSKEKNTNATVTAASTSSAASASSHTTVTPTKPSAPKTAAGMTDVKSPPAKKKMGIGLSLGPLNQSTPAAGTSGTSASPTNDESRFQENFLQHHKTLPPQNTKLPIPGLSAKPEGKLRRSSSDKALALAGQSLTITDFAKTKLVPDEIDLARDVMDWRSRIILNDPICSRVSDFLFLGSETVSANLQLLKQNGITHILNCAGTICKPYFPGEFNYRVLYLTDAREEDITCLFYDVIDWIEAARVAGGKVFVHCQQGVSRSSAMIIAYLMWKNGTEYPPTHEMVKQQRPVSNPNAGFAFQLLQWSKRRNQPVDVARMFEVMRHSTQDATYVPKQLKVPLSAYLRSVSCFIVETHDVFYLWRGSKALPECLTSAQRIVNQFQRFEIAPSRVVAVADGEEPDEFWKPLGGKPQADLPRGAPQYTHPPLAVKPSEERMIPARTPTAPGGSAIMSARGAHPMASAAGPPPPKQTAPRPEPSSSTVSRSGDKKEKKEKKEKKDKTDKKEKKDKSRKEKDRDRGELVDSKKDEKRHKKTHRRSQSTPNASGSNSIKDAILSAASPSTPAHTEKAKSKSLKQGRELIQSDGTPSSSLQPAPATTPSTAKPSGKFAINLPGKQT